MISAANTVKATKLVNAMTTDPVKRAQALSRIIQLNDAAFNELFSGLNTARYYTANIQNLGYINTPNLPTRVKIRFLWTDVLTGENGSGEKILFNALFEPTERWNDVLRNFDNNLAYISRINDKLFFKNPAVGGYNIPGYEPVILPGPGTGGGGVVTPDPSPDPNKTEFNIDSLIIPGAIALGLYLILK